MRRNVTVLLLGLPDDVAYVQQLLDGAVGLPRDQVAWSSYRGLDQVMALLWVPPVRKPKMVYRLMRLMFLALVPLCEQYSVRLPPLYTLQKMPKGYYDPAVIWGGDVQLW